MIAACPGCGARYRVDSSRVGPRGARVRCGRCDEIFRVEAEADRPRQCLLADADAERAKEIATSLAQQGVSVSIVHDGVDALVDLLRAPPSLAVFDEALPRISGSALCEVLKRDSALSRVHVVLGVPDEGAVPVISGELEPDAIVAWDDLGPWLVGRFGGTARGPQPEIDDAQEGSPSVDRSRIESDGLEEERASAERLARIVVSDIVLYDPERFDRAASGGRLAQVLSAELREGRALLERRVDWRVLEERDFLEEELARVVRTRRSSNVPG